ncbi:polysaccharide biosynthesis protein [Segetibacter aerophilus]|uniref:polysaccharide biosynthesis protein n=1 Tax=Segetibacter aerophilus TaxID=670293 RepID=UPI0011BD6404|nr:polysaccharide biosynthesis protein [Segetibacter aerophilus]
MSEPILKILNNPKYTRLIHWGKLITITGGSQAIVQATGLVSGIIVIRLLPTQQYAWYTLANTLLGTMGILADGGISAGVMAQGGKVWQDREKLGAVLATGLDLRKTFALGSLLVAVPLLIYLLNRSGASVITILLIVAALIPAFFVALSDSLLEIIPKLHQSIIPLQKNELTVSIARLMLSTLTLFIFPFSYIAILASGLPRAYGNIGLRKIAYSFVSKQQKPDLAVRKNILFIVKRILPGALYYCLSGQITIWLISIFGTTNSIAEVGALGRLAVLLNFFSVLISTLIIPRFARLENNKKLLLTRFFQIIGTLLIFCLLLLTVVWAFPEKILLILGNQYAGLEKELLINLIGSSIFLIGAIIYNLYTSKGWVLKPLVSISISICAITTGIIFLDVSTVSGVLWLNIFIAAIQLVYHTTYAVYKLVNI